MILLCLIETSKKTIRPNWRKVILHKLYLNPLNFVAERIASIFFPLVPLWMEGCRVVEPYAGIEFNKNERDEFLRKNPSL